MKAKIAVLGLTIFFITIIQSTVLEYATIYNVKPNLVLIFIVSVALLKGNVEGAIVGFVGGLLLDITGGKVIGFYALLRLYLGIAIGSVNKRIYRENVLVITFFTFVSTIVYEWCVYFLNTFINGGFDLIFPLRNIILPEAVYNSIVSIVIYIYTIKVYDKLNDMGKIQRKY